MSSPQIQTKRTTWGTRGLPIFPVRFALRQCPLSSAKGKIMGRRTKNNRAQAHYRALLEQEVESEKKRIVKKQRRVRRREVRREDDTLAEAMSGVKVGKPEVAAPKVGAPIKQTSVIMKDITRRTATGRIRKKDRERRKKIRERTEKSGRMVLDASES